MPSPLFVTFEGIEGSGKSTQVQLLSRHLTDRSIPHIVTREPGGTAVGENIRPILVNSQTIHLTAPAELLLLYASRSQNIHERIRPALTSGLLVLCDRYFDASMAYQGYGRGMDLDIIETLTHLVCGDCRPDLTFLLDIDPTIGLERARSRNAARAADEGRFEAEGVEFFSRVRQGYLELASREPSRIRVVRADQPIEIVHARLIEMLHERI